MTTDRHLTETSKFLSYILRHHPESIGITLDKEGWTDVNTLMTAAHHAGKVISRELIAAVIASCDKQRFTLSPDGARIRAAQGHSTASVALSYPEQTPPERLYHGTATRNLDGIRAQGLIAGARHHVHLSAEPATARAVGQRYGTPIVLGIAAQRMHALGHRFYRAENGVWLVAHVPAAFICFADPADA